MPHLWRGAASCRLFKISFLVEKRATGKTFRKKRWCQLQSLLTATQWLFHGKDKLLLEHGLKPWTTLSPGEQSLSFIVFHSFLRMLNVYKRSKVNRWKSQPIKSIKNKATTQKLLEPKTAGSCKDIQRKYHFMPFCSYTFPQAPAFGLRRRQNTRLDGLSTSKQGIFIKICL